MKVISIDPGVTTGFCYAEIVDEKKLAIAPFEINDEVEDLWKRFIKFGPDYIVMESFEFRGGKAATSGLNLFPVQLIGVARLYSAIAEKRLFLQTASTGKGYYTDPVLKQMGLHKRGVGHGMDALRHLLQWTTFGFGYQFFENKPGNISLVEMEYFT